MNLVAQEGPVVNERAGAVVLSKGAGCANLYGGHAVSIEDPTDVAGTADAVEAALALPSDVRQARAAAMRAIVESNTVPSWLAGQLLDLRAVAGGATPATPADPAPASPTSPPARGPAGPRGRDCLHTLSLVWPVSCWRWRRLRWRRR
jgi:trehalose-6-phosphate synthase